LGGGKGTHGIAAEASVGLPAMVAIVVDVEVVRELEVLSA
jgi:hypothetical protein